jgi:predicted MFS family arabinose efflux permease
LDTAISAAPFTGRKAWIISTTIAFSGTANFLGYLLPRPVLPAIQDALAIGPQDYVLVKLIMTAFIVGLIVGSPIAGFLLERISYRKVLIAAGLLFIAAGCSGYFISDLRVFVLSRFFTGAAAAALNITGVTMAGDLFEPERRAKWIGFIAAAGSLSAVVSQPLAGFAGNISWRVPFLLHLLALPIVVFALMMGRVDKPSRSIEGTLLPPAPFPKLLLVLGLVIGVFMTLPSIYIAFRIRDIGIVTPATIGLFFLALNVPEAIVAAFFGPVRKRIGARLVFVLGFGLGAVGLALLALVDAPIALLAGMALFGPGNSFLNANMMNVAAGVHAHRSRVVGIVLGAYCVGSVVGVLFLEAVFRGAKADGPLLAMAAAGAVAALYYVATRRRPMIPNTRTKMNA